MKTQLKFILIVAQKENKFNTKISYAEKLHSILLHRCMHMDILLFKRWNCYLF